MPPKKKKGSSKKSGKAKKGKKGEPQITFQEALLAYKIGLLEKRLEDWSYEEKNLLEQQERLTERSERLTGEREQYKKLLLKQAREFDRKEQNSSKVGKDKVMEALQDKWQTAKDEDRILEEMQEKILGIEKVIAETENELAAWLNFKNIGTKERAQQIELLEKELADMEQSYERMADHLQTSLETTKEKIIDHTERTLDKKKYDASEKAIATLDKKNRQEVLDNDWMVGEVVRYKQQCEEIQAQVEEIEKENLDIMNELFECTVEDLKITRNMFLTQFQESETLKDGGILEVDLRKVSLLDREKVTPENNSPHTPENQTAIAIREEDLNSEEFAEEYDGRPITPDSDGEDPFDNYYNFEDEDINEYLQLGPLELKLLSLIGTKMPIYGKGDEGITSSSQALPLDASEWPVTQPMMRGALTPR